MSGTSPESILYDISGNVLPVQNATSIPASTPGLLFMGSDGTNSRYITIDSSGRTITAGAGVAGTPAGGVLSIQGVAGGTVVPTSVTGTVTISGTVTANIGTTGGLALDTSVNGILLAQNSTTSGQTGPLIQGAVTTAAPSYTTAKTSPLSLTTAGALRIDGSAVTQPISGTVTANAGTGNFAVVQATAANLNATVIGTVTANIGTTNGLALDATLTGGTQTTRITDGTNTATVKAASTAAVATDKALVVAISPNNSVAVTGTVTANIGTTNGLALDATLAKLTITQGTALGSNTQALIGGSVTTASPTYTTGQISPISLTTAGALRVDGSGVTQPVSGTVAATQSGTWTVQPGNTANTTPWLTTISQGGNSASVSASNALKVDGSAVTQPVSGTVTANIGTTNGLALDTSVNGILVTQGSTTSGEKGPLIQGAVTTAAPAYTTAQTSPLSLTTAGALRIDGSAVTQPVSGTVTANQGGAPWSQNVTQFGGVNISTGTGASGTGIPRVTVANDSNILATQSGTWTVQPGNTANTTPWLATINQGGNSAAVKAASTAAVATDPALVVAISPNNSISIAGSADATATGNLNALNAAVQLAVNGENGAGMQLIAGTLIGTIVPEISLDGATTWVATFFDDPATGNKVSSIVFGSSNTATTRSIMGASGASHVRVRVSVFTSGAATCNLRASVFEDNSAMFDGAAGSTLAPTIAQVGGSVTTAAPSYSNATMNALSLNTSGGLRVDGSGVTQPVSGTITANIGTTNGLALDATLAKLTIAQGAALGANTQALIGGSVTTAAPTYTTGQISPLSLTTAGAIRIDGSGVTQPVSGTVTANIGTSGSLALDATLSAQSLVDNAAFTDGTSRVVPSGHIFDEVAGTALTENDVGASRIDSKRAQVMVIEDTTTRGQRVTVTASNAMKVDGSAVTQPVSGTVTANIGTSGSLALDASLTAQSMVDNAVFTDGTTRIVPAGFIFDEVAGTALTENDGAAARIDSKRALIGVIEDGTTRGTRVAVKAASTAAVATDPALVVAISPNNTVSIGAVTVSQSDVTATGSLNALNAAVSIALAGTAGAAMQLVAGTLIGTIVPEISTDGGTTYVAGQFFDPITGVLASSIVFASSNTAQTKTIIITGGTSHVRVRVSAFTSGTATCNLRATTANDPSTAIRGTDGTTLRTVLLDTSGRIVVAPAGTASTTSGFVNGDVLLSVVGNVVVRRTTLTEQSSNAQRSIVSASANDASAGTGARTVKITYYDSTGAGPSTETVTMNGTTAVNTVSTTICYVEKIEVVTVGSTGSNVGAITLKAATAGAGATIMTMNATDNLTYLSIHYVPTGKTCYITGIFCGSTSSGIAQGGLFTVRAQNLTGATNPDKQISDFLYLFGQSSSFTRTYGTPIQVVGPARLQLWVNPFSNNTVTFGGGFDFYEQ